MIAGSGAAVHEYTDVEQLPQILSTLFENR